MRVETLRVRMELLQPPRSHRDQRARLFGRHLRRGAQPRPLDPLPEGARKGLSGGEQGLHLAQVQGHVKLHQWHPVEA